MFLVDVLACLSVSVSKMDGLFWSFPVRFKSGVKCMLKSVIHLQT